MDRLTSVGPISGPPKYGMELTEEPNGGRTRLRKAALLALMALAASLILVLPEPEDESYALSSSQESTIRIGPETGPGAQRFSGPETGEEGDELALAPENGAEGNQTQFTQSDAGWLELEAISAGSELSTTTAPPSAPVVAEETTTAAPATTTTVAEVETTDPEQTTAEDGESSTTATPAPDDADVPATDPETTDSTAGTTDSEQTDAGTEETTDTTVPAETDETTDPGSADTEPSDTTPPETTPPETAPPETTPPVDPAYVDTGNGVFVPPVLLAIRFCESRDNYTAANPSSSARGGYQFLTGSWAAYGHKDRYGVNQAHLATAAQQDEAALLTWERDGTRPWNASKSCWSQRI